MITKICIPTKACRFLSTLCLKPGLFLSTIVDGLSLRVTVMVPFAAFSAALGIAQCLPAKKNTYIGGQGGNTNILEEGPAVADPAADDPEEGGANIFGTGILIVIKLVVDPFIVKLVEVPAIVDPAMG